MRGMGKNIFQFLFSCETLSWCRHVGNLSSNKVNDTQNHHITIQISEVLLITMIITMIIIYPYASLFIHISLLIRFHFHIHLQEDDLAVPESSLEFRQPAWIWGG